MSPGQFFSRGALTLSALLVVAAQPGGAQEARARSGRLAGRVTDAESKAPIAGVNVVIAGTTTGTTTREDGQYTLLNVPLGVVAVEARRIGFGLRRVDNVRISADSITRLDLTLSNNPLRLDEIVVSGTIDPMSSRKVPFTVARLDGERDIPVAPTANAAAAVKGKIAGVRVTPRGAPGSAVHIQLRSPTSQFKELSPLYVVDGVILGSTVVNSLSDIAGEDIESIEILKGAAAATLYGSRAANGVISIRTRRGGNLALNSSQFTLRTEYGFNQTGRVLEKPTFHHFLTNAQGEYLSRAGAVVARQFRVTDTIPFMDNAYRDPLYDHAKQFYRPGAFMSAVATMAQNTAATNFAATLTQSKSEGIIVGANGILRQGVRLNLDHRIGATLRLSASAYHQRSNEDPPTITFANLYRFDSDVDLNQRNPDGSPYKVLPDTLSTSVNPLYVQTVFNDQNTKRARSLIGVDGTYRPFSWLSVDGNVNYDRSDRERSLYTPRDILGTDGQTPTLGELIYTNDAVESINAAIGATATANIGDLTTRFTLRGIQEREQNPYFEATGTEFSVSNVKDLSVATKYTSASSFTDRRANSFLGGTTLDYAGKYIGDFLIRRDGSSLFGPDSRWNNYYRGSASWLIAEETWWPFANINAFKVRYSIGTAGTRPDFGDQYANLSLTAGGGITRQSFGNPRLRPEIAKEQEIGIDAIINNRFSVSLVYADLLSSDNIISAPLPALVGFNTQEQNIGKTKGNTFEATINAQILNGKTFQWESNLVLDRSRNRVKDFNRSCYTEVILNRCEGVVLGSMWGNAFIRSANQLRPVHANSRDQFQVNADGYLVAVGAGNTYRDGVSKNLWGKSVVVDGITYPWGRPILQLDSIDQVAYVQIGDSNADVNIGWGNTFRWKGLSLYLQFTGQLGGDIYNNTKQLLYQSLDHKDLVQVGKPDSLKKPTYYYNGQSGLSFNNGGYVNHFVESATHAKLNELQVRYTLPSAVMGKLSRLGFERVALDVTGRNLLIWTRYTGIDPEVSSIDQPFSRIDFQNYPIYRTFTAGVQVVF